MYHNKYLEISCSNNFVRNLTTPRKREILLSGKALEDTAAFLFNAYTTQAKDAGPVSQKRTFYYLGGEQLNNTDYNLFQNIIDKSINLIMPARKLIEAALKANTTQNEVDTVLQGLVGTAQAAAEGVPVVIDCLELARLLEFNIDDPKRLSDFKARLRRIKPIIVSASFIDTFIYPRAEWYKHIRVASNVVYSDEDNLLTIFFSPEFFKYLIPNAKCATTTFSPVLKYQLNARHLNAKNILTAFSAQWHKSSNQKIGTYNRLKVRTLLACTDIPNYGELSQNAARIWRKYIKRPFERELNYLSSVLCVATGQINRIPIKNWRYVKRVNGQAVEVDAKEVKRSNYSEWLEYTVVIDSDIFIAPEWYQQHCIEKAKKKRQQKAIAQNKAKRQPAARQPEQPAQDVNNLLAGAFGQDPQ